MSYQSVKLKVLLMRNHPRKLPFDIKLPIIQLFKYFKHKTVFFCTYKILHENLFNY